MGNKIFAFDLDSTTIDDFGNISKENINAISRLYNKGIITVVCTGRTFFEIPKEIRMSGAVSYYIYSDGAIVCKDYNEKIFENEMSISLSKEILTIIKKYSTMIEIYSLGNPYTQEKNINKKAFNYFKIDRVYHNVIINTRIPVKNLDDIIEKNEKIELFNIFFRHNKERIECLKELVKFDNEIDVTDSMSNNLEITKKNINKGTALLMLSKKLHIEKENITSIGDSKNDKEMMKVSGRPICVSNANEEIKKLSSLVICSNNENAIEHIEKRIFI